ncbi:hypothetical protein MES4922_550030 [Mesorhizobium ventifaucium]|uniref:Uncharacterized protein n=1 Tax=Mesorhizobium ventifaucium TaxID=666020 RepID=A0ABM9EC08_9HYPH|nr:hypothetical protein MES4922_550030 [Mesorhizobium ventifaucium]
MPNKPSARDRSNAGSGGPQALQRTAADFRCGAHCVGFPSNGCCSLAYLESQGYGLSFAPFAHGSSAAAFRLAGDLAAQNTEICPIGDCAALR